jgi:hypothetical protein
LLLLQHAMSRVCSSSFTNTSTMSRCHNAMLELSSCHLLHAITAWVADGPLHGSCHLGALCETLAMRSAGPSHASCCPGTAWEMPLRRPTLAGLACSVTANLVVGSVSGQEAKRDLLLCCFERDKPHVVVCFVTVASYVHSYIVFTLTYNFVVTLWLLI